MGTADVQYAMFDLAEALDDLDIPYAIAGAMAVNLHGHRRETEDVDVLLTAEGLRSFKDHCLGRGWVERFPGSKNMRDVRNNVKVDVLISGAYPGDGHRKPVRFPDPRDVSVEVGGLKAIDLPSLVELKLASAMTSPERPRDYDDVIRLIQANGLTQQFGLELNPWVREKYLEYWEYAQRSTDDY